MIGTTKIRKINNKANLQNAGTLVEGGIKQSKLQILMIYCDIIQLLHDIHTVITHQRRNIEVRDGDFNFRLLCIIQSPWIWLYVVRKSRNVLEFLWIIGVTTVFLIKCLLIIIMIPFFIVGYPLS